MTALRSLLAVAYPLWIYLGLQWFSPRILALGLVAIGLLRAWLQRGTPAPEQLRSLAPPAVAVGLVWTAAVVFDDPRFLLLVPALVNFGLLLTFARSLAGEGPPVIETLARLQVPDLPDDEVAYCRSVTRVWCLFFLANGSVCLALALAGDTASWAVYTGVVAYLLVGLVFAVEFCVRAKRFGRYEGTWVEPIFRRLFPRDGTT